MNTSSDTPGFAADPLISPWVARWAPELAQACRVLDVACGQGRHARWLAGHGFEVWAVDRDVPAELSGGIVFTQADIESGPWPYGGQQFDGVLVTNYLHRPLFPALLAAVPPGGLLIYETFAMGNERYGRPSRPEFLLQPGELLEVVRGSMTVLGYEHGVVSLPKPAVVQRIAARR